MLGWILHKHSNFLLKPETYEIQKLIEEGKKPLDVWRADNRKEWALLDAERRKPLL